MELARELKKLCNIIYYIIYNIYIDPEGDGGLN